MEQKKKTFKKRAPRPLSTGLPLCHYIIAIKTANKKMSAREPMSFQLIQSSGGSGFRKSHSGPSPPATRRRKLVARDCSTEKAYTEAGRYDGVEYYVKASEEVANLSNAEDVMELAPMAECRSQVCRGNIEDKFQQFKAEITRQTEQLKEQLKQHDVQIKQLMETDKMHKKNDAQLILRSFSCNMERIACWLTLRKKGIALKDCRKFWSLEKLNKVQESETIKREIIANAKTTLATWLGLTIRPSESTTIDTIVNQRIKCLFLTRQSGNCIAHPKVSDVDESQFKDYAKLARGEEWMSEMPIFQAFDKMKDDLKKEVPPEEFNLFIDYAEA